MHLWLLSWQAITCEQRCVVDVDTIASVVLTLHGIQCALCATPHGFAATTITVVRDVALSWHPYNMSMLYRAPELLDDEFGTITSKVDIWALACTIIEMGNGFVYPEGMTGTKIWERVLHQKRRPDIPDWFPVALQDILRKCLAMKADDRPTASQVLQVFSRLQLYCFFAVIYSLLYTHVKSYVQCARHPKPLLASGHRAHQANLWNPHLPARVCHHLSILALGVFSMLYTAINQQLAVLPTCVTGCVLCCTLQMT